MILSRRKEGKNWLKIEKADPEEVVHTYGIDCLNIGEAKHDSDDSERIYAQLRIGQI